MNRFHRILREALDAAPVLVGSVAADDNDRADLVGSYYANVFNLLHAHHEAEDLTIFPLLVGRLPEHVDVITRVNAEHDAVLGALEPAEQIVAAWRQQPSGAARDAAVEALASLRTILVAHLDHEEAEVVPLIALCINVAEWGEMSAVAFQRFSGDKPWLVIGLVQEQMLATENATMEANMPPPVHDFWVGSGRAMFQDFVAELRG
jgi:hemerythrin-like domain-containing protein